MVVQLSSISVWCTEYSCITAHSILMCLHTAEVALESQPGQRHTQASAVEAASSSSGSSSSSRGITVRNVERRHWAQPWRKNNEQLQSPVCTIDLPVAVKGWKGPRLNLSLPSFRCACLPAVATKLFESAKEICCCSCCNRICVSLLPALSHTCCSTCLISCCSLCLRTTYICACYIIFGTWGHASQCGENLALSALPGDSDLSPLQVLLQSVTLYQYQSCRADPECGYCTICAMCVSAC